MLLMAYLYHKAILGGTFDHFHLGHTRFLDAAFVQAQFITIGLVTSTFSPKILSSEIEPYAVRQQLLIKYLSDSGFTGRYELLPLSDIFGTALSDPSVEAIFVTTSTYSGALLINQERAKLTLPPLSIITLPLSLGDDQEIVSSSRIRSGLIDHLGHSYLKFFLSRPGYHLPDHLRSTLQHPLGQVVSDLSQLKSTLPLDSKIISVGDIVSINLKSVGYTPAISILDHYSRRTRLPDTEISQHFPSIHHHLLNTAGTINPGFGDLLLASLKTHQLSKETQVIMVEGEEDLLALPAMLLSPLGSFVIYGQHNLGICMVQVTPEIKSIAKEYLSQFDPSHSDKNSDK